MDRGPKSKDRGPNVQSQTIVHVYTAARLVRSGMGAYAGAARRRVHFATVLLQTPSGHRPGRHQARHALGSISKTTGWTVFSFRTVLQMSHIQGYQTRDVTGSGISHGLGWARSVLFILNKTGRPFGRFGNRSQTSELNARFRIDYVRHERPYAKPRSPCVGGFFLPSAILLAR